MRKKREKVCPEKLISRRETYPGEEKERKGMSREVVSKARGAGNTFLLGVSCAWLW